jgi:predicted dehydrogenase
MTTRIGFVDHVLDNFHANVFHDVISKQLKDRDFVVAGCTANDAPAGRIWAAAHEVPYFDDVHQLAEAVDCFMILAPSNPETHWEMCQRVFPFGKPTYVDKTFAPDSTVAAQIFALADRHRAPIQSSSALRYTTVQQHAKQLGRDSIRHMVVWGGGRSFEEYAIHPVEMLVSCMGPQARRLMRRGSETQAQLLIDFDDDRTAVANVYCDSATDFAATITTSRETVHLKVATDTLFVDAAAGILDFFDAGTPLIDRAETMAIRTILDAALNPTASQAFISLD